MIVAVVVVDGIYAIRSRSQIADCKLSELIGLRDAVKRECHYSRIRQISVCAHEHSLSRLEVFGTQHHAGDLQSVDMRACRECKRETIDGISLVEIRYRIGELHRVGSVGLH